MKVDHTNSIKAVFVEQLLPKAMKLVMEMDANCHLMSILPETWNKMALQKEIGNVSHHAAVIPASMAVPKIYLAQYLPTKDLTLEVRKIPFYRKTLSCTPLKTIGGKRTDTYSYIYIYSSCSNPRTRFCWWFEPRDRFSKVLFALGFTTSSQSHQLSSASAVMCDSGELASLHSLPGLGLGESYG